MQIGMHVHMRVCAKMVHICGERVLYQQKGAKIFGELVSSAQSVGVAALGDGSPKPLDRPSTAHR